MTNVHFNQFKDKTIDDYRPKTKTQQAAKELAADYIANIDKHIRGDCIGLTLVGPPGVGKTLLTHIVLNAARDNIKDCTYDALLMTRFIELNQELYRVEGLVKTMGYDHDPDDVNYLRKTWTRLRDLLTVDLVLFDDVGKEYDSGSGWSNSKFDYYMRHRWNAGHATFITSNVAIDRWGSRYSDSMESFLHESTIVISVDGTDARR